MRTLILGILAAIAVGTTISADIVTDYDTGSWVYSPLVKQQPMSEAELLHHQRLRFRMWNDLCIMYREESCAGIHAPKVKTFAPGSKRAGVMGYYDGSDAVYIRRNLTPLQKEEVIAHEMSHYLDVQLGITVVPGEALPICMSEKRAWGVSDKYWLRRGVAPNSKKIIGAKWVMWYSHCTPHKSVLYPDVYPT